MRKIPQPGPDDEWLCDRTAEDRGFSIDCVCYQGGDRQCCWRVYVDRNGVAYTVWVPLFWIPF